MEKIVENLLRFIFVRENLIYLYMPRLLSTLLPICKSFFSEIIDNLLIFFFYSHIVIPLYLLYYTSTTILTLPYQHFYICFHIIKLYSLLQKNSKIALKKVVLRVCL